MSATDRFDSGNYTTPTPDEIRAVMQRHELTGSAVSKIVGVSSRHVRHWTSHTSPKPMPYAAWRLLLLELGEIRQ